MTRWINTLLRKKQKPRPLAPDPPFQAIGDIHGRADLLEIALQNANPDMPLICVGDYIDRGDNSARVLKLLHKRTDITCLAGNHEQMLLAFLDTPAKHGTRWLRYGGLQTLASFGIANVTETANPDRLVKTGEALKAAIGNDLITWIRNLPISWSSGNITVTHAGPDPARAIDDQPPRNLLWGHPDFARKTRNDGLWILHGHTIVKTPTAQNGTIAIDTGAYATGKLTTATITPNNATFKTYINS